MTQYVTYIDESGNTGDNLTDKDQQIFAIAAVSILKDKQDELKRKLEAEFDTVREKGQQEIKATSWIKAPRQAKVLVKMLTILKDAGCDFSVVIMEKRFMTAALIVDNFLDGAYNDIPDYTWCNNHNEKVLAANYFYDILSDNDIKIVAKAFTNPTLEGQEQALSIVISKTKNPRYLTMLNGCHIKELYEDDVNAVKNNPALNPHVSRSPNYTAFTALGLRVAEYARNKNYRTDIVFDDCLLCNDAYKYLFEIFQRMQADPLLEQMTGLFPWKDRIDSFSVANSKSTIFLQTADILATSTLKTLEKVFSGTELSDYNKFMQTVIHDMLITNGFWYVMCNDKINKLAEFLLKNAH